MRLSSDVNRSISALLLLALVGGCAGPSRSTRPATPPLPPVPAPLATPSPTPPPPPAPPVVAPRAEPAKPEPPRVAAPAAPAAPPAAPPTAPPVPPGQRGRFIVLNFDNADIETVIHAASEIVGFNYVIGPGVSGKKVTVQTSGRIPQEDVFGVLLAILEVHGVTAVRAGNLYKIVPIEGARERAVPTIVGATPDAARSGDEVVTQIIPIRFAPVNDLGTLLRPLISSKGTLIANRETGILIITDSASNIGRLLDIIRLVDVEVALDELQIIPMQYADATETANILNQLFQSGRLRAGGGAATGVPAPPAAPGVPGAPAATGQPGGTDRPPLIVAERRSNSLIVNARKGEMETIRRVLDKLDVNVSGGRRVFIYYAENAKAKDLASTLNAIYTGRETVATTSLPLSTPSSQTGRTAGTPPLPLPPPPSAGPAGPLGGTEAPLADSQVRFIADEVTNAIIVTTTPRQWMDIEATIKQLDKMPRQVLIEVLVAEIQLTDDTRLGLDWALKAGTYRVGQDVITPAPPTNRLASIPPFDVRGAVPLLASGGLTAFAFEASKFFAILNTLASENRVNIVSNPHVLTSENKKAVINVSTSVPIVTGQQTGTTTGVVTPDAPVIGPSPGPQTTGSLNQTVEYRDAGVVLTVTPRIGERGTVALDVKQEVNAVGPLVPPTGSPSFIKREAETSVVLLNNQTLVLGGLIQDRVTVDDRGVPFLKNIPLIGYIFGFKEKKIEKTELLLLITPRVIGTALDAARVTDEMRRVSPEVDEAIRAAPRAPNTGLPPLAPPPVPAPSGPPPELPPASTPAPGPPAAVTPPAVAPPPAGPAPASVPPIPPAPPVVTPAPAAPAPAPAPPLSVPPVPPATPTPPGAPIVPAPPAPGTSSAPQVVPPSGAGPTGPPARQAPRPSVRQFLVPVPAEEQPAQSPDTSQPAPPAAPPPRGN